MTGLYSETIAKLRRDVDFMRDVHRASEHGETHRKIRQLLLEATQAGNERLAEITLEAAGLVERWRATRGQPASGRATYLGILSARDDADAKRSLDAAIDAATNALPDASAAAAAEIRRRRDMLFELRASIPF